jgi:hypothetical protein
MGANVAGLTRSASHRSAQKQKRAGQRVQSGTNGLSPCDSSLAILRAVVARLRRVCPRPSESGLVKRPRSIEIRRLRSKAGRVMKRSLAARNKVFQPPAVIEHASSVGRGFIVIRTVSLITIRARGVERSIPFRTANTKLRLPNMGIGLARSFCANHRTR